ncbi:alanine--tRNA ligase [Alkalitalea saponilacus]|uniref:Alanine--tRNA ligase n=1 Tax=Alkalitalea saponilacus TaxID=889453 RepID=A0A1T5BPE4_9BACT|nr:alanine--tRNA ligase [Alkalitalea saponilacus]ASB49642.1 alanine--tRNA ligase [Alkalitalea saponilacus]SKB48763.1 alanyl-tRNA synthetase [Alkalitalea saponilacus]
MTASEIRNSFLTFFESKQHKIVDSAPMVVKDDPTLMFTNAGMNQFKDIFLGNAPAKFPRVANSQKCLRVSGKHNDLEEVGHDTYHHTMFEMLGNWSFGDYFKKEAIDWAWEYLTEVLKIDKSCLYVSIFEGDAKDGIERDEEALEYWKNHVPENRIINGNKKDNFWEMGDTGPCGPCSEIHVDLRSSDEKEQIPGENLVNKDHPEVIEVWNLVFIQYNRKADGSLVPLPQKHVDTGMGFERLCRVIQGKMSNYDTDVFQPVIQKISSISDIKYGNSPESDIAMRVIADHIRTISFAITDGQLPSNNKAGYVIRRILRRAVRYAYTFLDLKKPFMGELLPELIATMGTAYPELENRKELIQKVVKEEEDSFLRTLSTGITLLDKIIKDTRENDYKVVDGKVAFELYDTFGFPLDLTELILKENGLVVNRKEFETEMEAQKTRARNAAAVETDDWVVLTNDDTEEFIGYDFLDSEIQLVKYRKVKSKNKELYQLVFNITPFYAESGGQVGDCGFIENSEERIPIIDTKRENNLIIHIAPKLPKDLNATFKAQVDLDKRRMTASHHSATHLLHKALREILGSHVEQKGSLVHPDYLRFDFSHFQKLTDEEINAIEKIVNSEIRKNLPLEEHRELPVSKAKEMGAMALFGEKYGDVVRTIGFGDSLELCGGTHVNATGQIGIFRIISESSIAAGIRRIEAVVADKAEELINQQADTLKELGSLFKNQFHIQKNVENLINENASLNKELNALKQSIIQNEISSFIGHAETIGGVKVIGARVKPMLAGNLKDIAFNLRTACDGSMIAVLGVAADDKAQLTVIMSEDLSKEKNLNAVEIIKSVSQEIKGGGGGQPFFATAGGKNPDGIDSALAKAIKLIKEKLQ